MAQEIMNVEEIDSEVNTLLYSELVDE